MTDSQARTTTIQGSRMPWRLSVQGKMKGNQRHSKPPLRRFILRLVWRGQFTESRTDGCRIQPMYVGDVYSASSAGIALLRPMAASTPTLVIRPSANWIGEEAVYYRTPFGRLTASAGFSIQNSIPTYQELRGLQIQDSNYPLTHKGDLGAGGAD
ncbi:predicted protein [Pyrenophora tritici-repentis Pt-1C-BFP]|uniref:Uncharacterized protein n=1 Tax=Pyrenophora tritici-repentis (strain Pt-1C-BFP) TaxID=426418 RepID=B2WLV5_PYRTR|nr:uncharacterized protein PTRG_10965 [Pyrenophora tritici-repentis Pt-1C-BFP]EDU44015.1 predicted protein [Pyrenophora tritici-repentis Pt-1C-BFP]